MLDTKWRINQQRKLVQVVVCPKCGSSENLDVAYEVGLN